MVRDTASVAVFRLALQKARLSLQQANRQDTDSE